MADARRGLGHAFLDQDRRRIRQVKTGRTYLIHRVGADMRRRNEGLILITGSIAGFTPGSFQAAYNAAKAYLNSFSFGR
jgi:short-subunit dehydrogenase